MVVSTHLRVVLEDPVEEIDRKGIQRYAREVGNLSVAVADHPLRVDCRNQLLHGLAGRGVREVRMVRPRSCCFACEMLAMQVEKIFLQVEVQRVVVAVWHGRDDPLCDECRQGLADQ